MTPPADGVRRIEGAGHFTRPHLGGAHWLEHMRSGHLSVGTYSLAAAGTDAQVPHTEDEIYFVTAGRARLQTPSGALSIEPGHVIFVPAHEQHAFVDISEDFAAVVVFAPPEQAAT